MKIEIKNFRRFLAVLILGMLTTFSTFIFSATIIIADEIDWQSFLSKQDIIWEKLPSQFDHGAFLGNGLLGTTIFQDAPNQLRFEIGRSDVTDHRRDNARLPIGGILLITAGKIQSGKLRTDLWNAEVQGEIITDKGTIKFRAINHTSEIILLVDLELIGDEKNASFQWSHKDAAVFRDEINKVKIPPNPKPEIGVENEINYCEQKRVSGGSFTSAWIVSDEASDKSEKSDKSENKSADKLSGDVIKSIKKRLTFTISDKFPRLNQPADSIDSKRESLDTVKRVAKISTSALIKTHRDWWHNYYPQSFVSVPDSQVESFYWIQIYKFASGTRSDRMVFDELGPWYRHTHWPRVWWDLNIQIAYLPVYTANRLEIGESFIRFIDKNRDNFVKNAKDLWKFDDCATVSVTTDNEGLRGNGTLAPDVYLNPGDFTWALHLYWLHYRYSMDESLITTDRNVHAFYQLLCQSVNLYSNILTKGGDGKLHLPVMMSPEYGKDADNNYNLSLLRWACMTLIYLDDRYKFKDSRRVRWEEILRDLVDYPRDENGFRVGRDLSFTRSHRHWSHILMVWSLHILSTEQPENKEIVERSVGHWLTVENSREIFGWSFAAASAIYSTLGDGENALRCLRGHHDSKRFVMPNTQYIEGSPVVECAFVAVQSLQEMLLQSWGDVIRIFPAVSAEWKDVVFRDFRAEGAFLVTAIRKDGKTSWIRIKSLAGEPCKVKPNFVGEFKLSDKSISIKEISAGVFELGLKKDQEIILYQDKNDLKQKITPVKIQQEKINFWGIK